MRVVSADEIDRALTFPALADALAEGFRGGMTAPVRHHHTVPQPGADATLLLMPAWTAGSGSSFAGVKVVTVYPDNAQAGQPSVIGTYLLLDGSTGRPLAALDGTRLTLWRTAAASALAAGHLARPDAARMVMVGAGALAPFLIRAHLSRRPTITSVQIWNRRPESAAALATELAAGGLAATVSVSAVTDLEEAVRAADLVSCATLSTAPIVRGAWLKPGAHLDLVGAFNLAMREADDEALARASVFVDTPAARHEGGDVAVAIRAGAFDEGRIRGDLADLVSGRAPGRLAPDEITLFKSVGASVEDLAAAMLVWSRLD
ncbi:MAG: ornithine cyclodeaminase family protein [Enterovirga sp.]|nr:ornithine cyclodeaminase family protein [Enterovirga sp.]